MIETDTFHINVPEHWKVEKLEKQLNVFTPRGGLLILWPTSIRDGEPPAEKNRMMNQLEQNALFAMRKAAEDDQLGRPMGPDKEVLYNGTVFYIMASITPNKSHFLAQYCIRGPRTVILATFEGPGPAGAEISIVSQFLKTVRWL